MLPAVRGPAIWTLGLTVLGTMVLTTPASGQDAPKTGPQAVALARAAFEYRDFERVVELLDPWLHPPRLIERDLKIEARRLMGISLHLLDDVRAARDEFAQLLELDPDHTLDAFVTPPDVIQTFEAIRTEMKPALDAQRPPPPPPEASLPKVQTTIHPAINFLPFGLPQFVQNQPTWGAVWAVLQAAFWALNVVGFFQADSFRKAAGDGHSNWLIVQYTGLAGLATTWTASGLHGYFRWLETAPDPALAGPSPRGAGRSATVGPQIRLEF